MNRVVVIGDALVDEMRDERGSVDAPGGSALNVAVGLGILGVPATLIAMIGDDADGASLRHYAESHGVVVMSSAAPLGTGRAISDRTEGEPTYSFSPAARERTLTFSNPMLAAITEAPLVAISGFPFDTPSEFAALRGAVSGHPRLLIDANPRAGFLTDRAAFARALEDLAASAELVKIGDEDARLLYGTSVRDAAARLSSRFVLATEGSRGATIFGAERAHQAITPDPRPIVDTMGAGDATFASVIAQRARGAQSWSTMLETAMSIAAETIRHPGGTLRLR